MNRKKAVASWLSAVLYALFVLFALAAAWPAAVSGQTLLEQELRPPEELEELRAEIRREMIRNDLPSIAIGVAHRGEIIWQEGFGWADREQRVPSGPHTMYSIASISKPLTATAIMKLVEDGEIDLDEPVNRYLDDAALTAHAGDADRATVRKVLQHTAGLPLHYQFFYEDEPYDTPPMNESIRRYGILVTEPGERYQYSNIGYGVLDHVISTVSGRDYQDYMRREIFSPLGMYRTSVHLPPRLEEYQAVRYSPDQEPVPYYDFDHDGASAVYSSVNDLLRFAMFHMGGLPAGASEVLSLQAREQMQSDYTETGGRSGYGLGWLTRQHENGLQEVYHSGSMGGVRTMLTMAPEEDLAVVALTNTRSNVTMNKAREVLHAMLPEKADDPNNPDGNPSGGRDAFEAPEELEGRWEGRIVTHRDTLDAVFYIRSGGVIVVDLEGQHQTLLNNPGLNEDDELTGTFIGRLGTEDVERHNYFLRLDARWRGDRLYGAVTAMSRGDEDRVGNALSSFIELEKQ